MRLRVCAVLPCRDVVRRHLRSAIMPRGCEEHHVICQTARGSEVKQDSIQTSIVHPAPVRPTSARTALPPICFGHIDLRTQTDVANARRTAETYVPQPIDHQIVSRLCHRRSATALGSWCRPRETASIGRTAE